MLHILVTAPCGTERRCARRRAAASSRRSRLSNVSSTSGANAAATDLRRHQHHECAGISSITRAELKTTTEFTMTFDRRDAIAELQRIEREIGGPGGPEARRTALLCDVSARQKCHPVCKVEMTPGRRDGLTPPQLLPTPRAKDGPLSAFPVPPDCLVAAGVVDRPAYGFADTTPAAPARTPVLRRAACSRRSRRAPPSK
jgi:hypothetical protein